MRTYFHVAREDGEWIIKGDHPDVSQGQGPFLYGKDRAAARRDCRDMNAEARAADRRTADRIDGFDRDDLGESPDF